LKELIEINLSRTDSTTSSSRYSSGWYSGVFITIRDAEIPEHQHEAQWGTVLEGRIDLVIDGKPFSFKKGDHYFIPKGIKHSAKIYAGYADVTFFNQKDRYKIISK
jgi:ethanolamine utilization protein EutQ (cupin superfamily)